MKALLIAAALAIPVAATANPPDTSGKSTKTSQPTQNTGQDQRDIPEAGTPERWQSGTLSGARSGSAIGADELFSAAAVVDKLHHVNKKNIEYGNLARTRGGNEQIRKFGAKLVKDHQRLDDAVITYASANRIELGKAQQELKGRSQLGYGGDRTDDVTTLGSQQGLDQGTPGGSGKPAGDIVSQATRDDLTGTSGAMGGTGTDQPAAETGGSTTHAGDLGSNDRTANEAIGQTGPGESGEMQYGEKTREQKQQEFQAKLDELKDLQGSEFDSQFLSNVLETSERSLTRLQGWKGQGDKKLNVLIDRAIKVIGDHQKEAQRLQQKIPAA